MAEAGWRFVHLDASQVEGKSCFLELAATAFGFPDYFGRNWDALADSLGDVRSEPGTVVLWDGWSAFASADEEAFAVALDIVGQRTESPRGGAFVVLMRDESDPSGEP